MDLKAQRIVDKHSFIEMSLKGKTLFITGATRGIGLAIAVRAARDGANVAIAAKTDTPHPKLPGTLSSAAKEIEDAGGRCLAIKCDIRSAEQLQGAIDKTAQTFGGIDILVNNASAISLTDTLSTNVKTFDLMNQVNARGTFMASKFALPYLLKSSNPHILTLSPPLDMKPKWFKDHTAYTMAKYGMSMCVLGMAEEFKGKVAVNALWPRTLVATAAVNMLGGDSLLSQARKPEIMADAAHAILVKPVAKCSGNFFIDDDVLRQEGMTNFDKYAYKPGEQLAVDLFVEDDGSLNMSSKL